jgi:hypothetical protein
MIQRSICLYLKDSNEQSEKAAGDTKGRRKEMDNGGSQP